LLIRARVRPCSARAWGDSILRPTLIWLAAESNWTSMSAGKLQLSSPLGPLVLNVRSRNSTFTPLGTAMGFFPMRDINRSNVGRALPANALDLPARRAVPALL